SLAENIDRRATRASEKVPRGNGHAAPKPGKDKEGSDTIKLPTRGKPKNNSNGNSISNYCKKADVQVSGNPSVQEALEQAADEFEAKPSALGEQDLVATQQPSLVIGGQMREYQLEGLEWLKSLWMNGL